MQARMTLVNSFSTKRIIGMKLTTEQVKNKHKLVSNSTNGEFVNKPQNTNHGYGQKKQAVVLQK